jgi:methyltransferase
MREPMTAAQWIVLAVALQRLGELIYARRNERRLRQAGAVEVGAGHYPLIVLLHASWLVTLFVIAGRVGAPSWPIVAIYALLQLARLWVIVTLGRFWTTRILTHADAPLVTSGPYRLCRHPNYAIVAIEIALLPLAFGAWQTALLFSLANGVLLWWRIRVEDQALRTRRAAHAAAPGG